MKWFKHETDAHMNLKLQSVIERYGLSAYGYYWACVELVGKEGTDYRISASKNWKLYFKKFLNIDTKTQDLYLGCFAEINLIDSNSHLDGDLHMPKLAERCDDYTERIRRRSVHNTDNVPLEEKRREKKRREYKYTDEFESFWSLYPKKVNKPKTFDVWKSLNESEMRSVVLDVPKRKADDKWVNGFVKDPERYLSHRQWEDDIVRPKVPKQTVAPSKKISDQPDDYFRDKRSPEDIERVRKLFEESKRRT